MSNPTPAQDYTPLHPDIQDAMRAIPTAILALGPLTNRELSDYIDGVDWICVYAAARKLCAMGIIFRVGTRPEYRRWHMPTKRAARGW
jgi:hypothetical protein